jgi:transcription initiation factor TFIID subunit 5
MLSFLKGCILALAISPDGQYLVSSGEDRRIRVWDLTAGGLLKELRGHTDTVNSVCFSADGTLLASGGMDSHVRVWDFQQVSKCASSTASSQSSELLASFSTRNASVHSVKFSSCNLVLAAGANSV